MAHWVKCKICGVKFDRDKEEAVPAGNRRYAHAKCTDGEYEPSQEEVDAASLHEYLKALFKDDYNYVSLEREIKRYRENYNYTLSGILKTLIYWYDLKGNSKELSEGRIGIVPYVYEDAKKYYYALWVANQTNMDKDLSIYKVPNIMEVHIKKPERDPIARTHLFDLDS